MVLSVLAAMVVAGRHLTLSALPRAGRLRATERRLHIRRRRRAGRDRRRRARAADRVGRPANNPDPGPRLEVSAGAEEGCREEGHADADSCPAAETLTQHPPREQGDLAVVA